MGRIGTLIARSRSSWFMVWILQHLHAYIGRGAEQQQLGVQKNRDRMVQSSDFFADFTGEWMASIGMGNAWGWLYDIRS